MGSGRGGSRVETLGSFRKELASARGDAKFIDLFEVVGTVDDLGTDVIHSEGLVEDLSDQ